MTVEPFVCRIVKTRGGDADTDSGSGIIAKFEPEFWDYLTQPSCLGEKYDLSVLQSRSFYVLLTAHRNVYEENEEGDKPLADYVDSYTLELDTAVKIPLRECIFPAVNGGCIAVSCCGVDSILVLCDPGDNLTYTLKAHRHSKCCIMSDFLLLFLDAEKVNTRLGSDCGSPPTFCKPVAPQSTESECCMYWRTAAGAVEKCDVHLQTSIKAADSDSPQEKSLRHDVEIFHQQRSLSLREDVSKELCCIGAPIFCSTPDSGVRIVGINTGGAVTTLYGVFNLLKGGLIPFMAAVDPNHSKTRTLMPSRWKKHVTLFISQDTLPNLSSVLDLLQCLLHSENCVRLLKFSPKGGAPKLEIVSGLEVYTAIFRHYGTLVEQGQSNPSEYRMACLEQIVDEMVEVTKHFAGDDQPPEDIVVALFECFEAMQSFSFEGTAQTILEKTRGYLDKISMKSNIDSNATVNKCFKHIDVLARQGGQEYRRQESSAQYGQATEGNGYNLLVNSSTYKK